jgi:hypothetical protein
MLTLERLRSGFLTLPILARIGLLIMAFGGFADVTAHLEAAGHADHLHEHTTSELSAHLIGFIGMVAIFIGVVADGARRTLRDRAVADHSKGAQ